MEGQDKKVNLLMAIHCHQPVSNFPSIFQDAFEKAYLPFLDVFEEFSNIKLSLHYSGSLLDWFIEKHPEFIKRIKLLVKEKRVEIIGGGYFEPILALVPYRDAVGQIKMFTEKIKDVLEYDCRGIWLTERVWEPNLPYLLDEAGVKFTIVDDSHFKTVNMDPEKLNGYYLCEEQLKNVLIFPGSEKLRYLFPFRLIEETIFYLRERLALQAGNLTITFADDGEKFGLWPGTNKWVYKEKWLKNFFTFLDDNKSWINTSLFSDCINKSRATDRIYLPCASYREMQEWSGGFFRNFLVKYPEANNMQKKMFLVSDKFNEIQKKDNSNIKTLALIKKHLYMGQFNDVYWHGIFGGLYLNHLRSGAYENLIKAEGLIDKLEKKDSEIMQCDFDRDGKDELLVSNNRMRLYFRPQEGLVISEWDDKLRNFNLTNTISRRFENYHQQLKEKAALSNQNAQPASIHNQRPIKEEGLDKILFYDRYLRYSLRDYLLEDDTKLDNFYKCTYKEAAQIKDTPYETADKSIDKEKILEFSRKEIVDMCVLRLSKRVSIIDNIISVNYQLENFGTKDLNFIFGTEFNLSLYDSDFSTVINEESNISKLVIHDLWKNVKLEFYLDPKGDVWHFPIETISDSELGIEKTYQELCLFFKWRVCLKQNSNLTFKLQAKLY